MLCVSQACVIVCQYISVKCKQYVPGVHPPPRTPVYEAIYIEAIATMTVSKFQII